MCLLVVTLFMTIMNVSADQGRSYASPEYYLGAGGQPPSLEVLSVNPERFFRHEQALKLFRALALGNQSIFDLYQQSRVRTILCQGEIQTSGITPSGEAYWFTRPCYEGEELIQVRAQEGARWVTVASLGCLNPVRNFFSSSVVVTHEPEYPEKRDGRALRKDSGCVSYRSVTTERTPSVFVQVPTRNMSYRITNGGTNIGMEIGYKTKHQTMHITGDEYTVTSSRSCF